MYQALYRKYRPKVFDDVVGQEHITRTLKNEIAAGKPSHAYLFCGTRGTGKTTCSKILAKAVNCPNQEDGNPCCACDICRGIEEDSILDVTEIDAASNSGVDNIRELREEAFYTPTVAKYRVYIIDETHMLSTGAFNALLKIMEEPPPHVLFVLATTETHKVPATILSRCQRFDFRRIPSGIIAGRLLDIAGQEGIDLHADAAELIALLSDGGMRDAISLLDLCISVGGEESVSTQVVREQAGLLGQEHLFDIGEAAATGDSGKIFLVLEELRKSSVDYQRLCEQLIGFYRNLMVAKSVKNPKELIACLPQELERYRKMSADMPMPRILGCLDILQEVLVRMSRTSMRRTELELGLLRLCSPDWDTSVSALKARIEKLEKQVREGAISPRPAAQGKSAADALADASPSEEEVAKTPVEPFGQWPQVLEALKGKNMALYGALVESDAFVGGGLLLVKASDLFAQIVRSDSYAKDSLHQAVIEVTGRKYRLGPYNEKKYRVGGPQDKLGDILSKASELGADVQIKS